jgi:hypothetical protein
MKSTLRLLIPLTLLLAFQMTGHGQTTPPAGLRDRITMRFDVVALQQGVALVPRDAGASVRMIQVVDGVVTVDGVSLTGGQLRDRLGADADLVLQVSYMDREQQRALVPGGTGGAGATFDPPPAAPAPATVERSEIRRGDIVRFGDAVTVQTNERVEGDVVVFGDSADIDGEVTGDVTVFGDRLRLGPNAVVRGDVNAIGGNLDREDGAQVEGEVNEVGRGRGRIRGDVNFPGMFFDSMWSRLWGFGATILRLTVLVLVGLIIVAFGRNAVERIGGRIAATPVRSGLIGLAAEVLFLPVTVLTVVVLAISIVGIPLLVLVPFAILLVMLVGLVGFIALAHHVGGRLSARFGWSAPSPYASVAIGVLAVGTLTLIGRLAGLAGGFFLGAPLTGLGYLLEYVAWTVGFGAALLYWYEMQPGFGPRRTAGSGLTAQDPGPSSPPSPEP